jgi:hypothetical protein
VLDRHAADTPGKERQADRALALLRLGCTECSLLEVPFRQNRSVWLRGRFPAQRRCEMDVGNLVISLSAVTLCVTTFGIDMWNDDRKMKKYRKYMNQYEQPHHIHVIEEKKK